MASTSQLEVLRQNVVAWNIWRDENPEIRPDLSGAQLTSISLAGANLSRANLAGANLARANLRGANLRRANLKRASLSEANLNKADLRLVNMDNAFCNLAHFDGARLDRLSARWVRFFRATFLSAVLKNANLLDADFNEAVMDGADLRGANLKLATLTKTKLREAKLSGAKVFGASVWKTALDGAVQENLVVSDEDEPRITVDHLEMAQFIYLLLDHQNLRSVLNAVTKKGVLLLGRFGGGGLEVLDALAVALRSRDYIPMVFSFSRPDNQDYTETIQTLAGLSRFVIVDLSGPSVPQELQTIVPIVKIPYLPIIENGRSIFATFKVLYQYGWVSRPVLKFLNLSNLLDQLPRLIEHAENLSRERSQQLSTLFADE